MGLHVVVELLDYKEPVRVAVVSARARLSPAGAGRLERHALGKSRCNPRMTTRTVVHHLVRDNNFVTDREDNNGRTGRSMPGQ